jgi:MbtH protein
MISPQVPSIDTLSSVAPAPIDAYWVVKNHEEQFSIWPTWRQVPLGWICVGEPQEREQALNWIESNWTDMRPASLRRWLEDSAKHG